MESLEKMEPAFFLVVLLPFVGEKKEEDQHKRRKGNRYKMELKKFLFDTRINITIRMSKHWIGDPNEPYILHLWRYPIIDWTQP